MLSLDEINLEALRFSSPDACDAVLMTTRRGHNLIHSHGTSLQLRNINLSVKHLHTHGQEVQRYTLSFNRANGTARFSYERPAHPGGTLRCGRTETSHVLKGHLDNCWVSYVSLSGELGHFGEPVSGTFVELRSAFF